MPVLRGCSKEIKERFCFCEGFCEHREKKEKGYLRLLQKRGILLVISHGGGYVLLTTISSSQI